MNSKILQESSLLGVCTLAKLNSRTHPSPISFTFKTLITLEKCTKMQVEKLSRRCSQSIGLKLTKKAEVNSTLG